MIALLLALTMQVQDTATVQVRVPPPIVQINGDSIYVNVEVGTDSLAAVLKANLEAALGQQPVASSSTRPMWQGAAILAVGIGIGYLIWGRESDDDKQEWPPFPDHNHDPDHHHCWPPGHCKGG